MTENKALDQFRAWAKAKIDGIGSFNVPDLVKEAEVEFSGNAKFLNAFARATIRDRMATEIRRIVTEARASIVQITPGTFVDPTRLEEAADAAALGVWGRWKGCYEHIGQSYLLVLDMHDADLVEAENARLGLSESHLKWARFFRALRPRMKRNKPVRDCFSSDELDLMWDENANGNQQEVA